MTACKKPLCGILAFILVFVFIAAVPVSVYAEDEQTTYSAQEIELNKKTDENGFEYIPIGDGSALEIVGYVGSEKEISVPTRINSLSVISIGAGCFEGNTTIEAIKLHNDINIIGDNAFKGCTALKEIKGDDAITTFGVSAFDGCVALEEYQIPDSVTDIPSRCFADCKALVEIKEHKNLKNVAADAFVGSAWENAKEDGPLSFGRVLYSYKGEVKDMVIPKGISIIEDYAFLGCEFIETLTLGEDVEAIGLYAFQNCVNLKSVEVDDAMGILSAGAFKGCSSLTSIDFSESTLATIGYESFADCVSLAEVKLSETLSDIGDYAFANTQIKTIEMLKNVNSIGTNTFAGVKTLESVQVIDKNKTFKTIDGVLYSKDEKALILFPAAKTGEFELPQSVEEIKDKAFIDSAVSVVKLAEEPSLRYIGISAFENSAITSFEIPANVVTLKNAIFKNATKLSKIVFNEGLTYIGASAFEGCTALTEIKLPESMVDVANNAFKNAGLKSVNTGDGLLKIASDAFAGNKKLTDVYLGKNVEKLGEGAFKDCAALVAVNLPASLKDFSALAFAGCTSLAKITVDAENKAFKAVGTAVYSADGTKLVIAGNAKSATVTIAEGTEVIAANAFDLAKNATAIVFPKTLVNVEANALDVTAWYEASLGVVYAGSVLYKVKGEMADLVVAEGVKTISDGAVKNASVKTVTLPASLVRICDGAFAGSSIATIVIPDNVTYIGIGAFENVTALKNVKLPAKLEVLETGAFKGCSALTEIVIPAGVKAIPSDAFAGCEKLAKVNLGSVEEIEQYAFSGCSALKEITIPATVTDCNVLAFVGCKLLENILVDEANATYKALDGIVLVANDEGEFDTIAIYPAGKKGEYSVPETIKNIADRAFYDCDGLTAINFVEGFTNIGAEAFFDCDSIVSIVMPESARNIGDHSFASCDKLVEFVVFSNLTDYADNAFDGCYYFNYDAVTINVEDNSGALLAVIAGVFVIIGVIWYISYNKKQKKIQKEIEEKNKIDEEIARMEAEEAKEDNEEATDETASESEAETVEQ